MHTINILHLPIQSKQKRRPMARIPLIVRLQMRLAMMIINRTRWANEEMQAENARLKAQVDRLINHNLVLRDELETIQEWMRRAA